MKIEILSDTFVTSVDFLKVFFCLKYLMSFQLQMKIKPVALSVSGYFFIMMIFHHVPWLGFFSPATYFPFIFLLLILQGMAFSFKNIRLTGLIYLLVCQIDNFIDTLLELIFP